MKPMQVNSNFRPSILTLPEYDGRKRSGGDDSACDGGAFRFAHFADSVGFVADAVVDCGSSGEPLLVEGTRDRFQLFFYLNRFCPQF